MPTILITGGTGLVGKALTTLLLQKGYTVIILTRKLPVGDQQPGVQFALWNVKKQTIDIAALQRADYIIHLAGAGVMDKKWSPEYKNEIISSRVESAKLLVHTLKNNPNTIKAVVSSSAIGWYQVVPVVHTEEEPADDSYLGHTCKLWEESIAGVEELGKRLVKLRTGIVLSKEGGALKEFITPQKLGIAAILGTGKQMVSWIHIDDLCAMYVAAIENEQLTGAYNAVAPGPVSNKTLTLTLAKKRNGSLYIPVHIPGFVLKLMLGDRSVEILKDLTVSCKKILATGFSFRFADIDAALDNLVNSTDRR